MACYLCFQILTFCIWIFLNKANPIVTLVGDVIHVVDAKNSIPFFFWQLNGLVVLGDNLLNIMNK